MKNISNINPIDYHSFYFLGNVGEVELTSRRSTGYLPISEYDLINCNGNTIIGYKTPNIGEHEHSYVIDGNRKYIQMIFHDQLYDFLNLVEYPHFKFFLFVNSVELPSYDDYIMKYKPVSMDKSGNLPFRCDYNKYGGAAFNTPKNGYTFSKMLNILSISGAGHLAYFETLDEKNKNINDESINIGARTYAGILKVLYEWSIVYEDPFNNKTEIAKKANEMWKALDLPEDLKNWIINEYCDMRVARYLKGENVIVEDVEGEELMPDVLKNYIQSNCRYRTLASMKIHHPDASDIPDQIIDVESESLDKNIFNFLILNNIDLNIDNFKELAVNILFNRDKYIQPSEYDINWTLEKAICM